MGGFLASWMSDFRTRVPYLLWAGLTVTVGLAGPFGTYASFDFGTRLMFWGVILAFVIVYSSGVRAFVHHSLGLNRFSNGSPVIAAILAITVPPAVLNIIPILLRDGGALVPGQWELAIFIFAASISVGAFRHAMAPQPTGPVPVPEPAPPASAVVHAPANPRLIRRLPEAMRGTLISISVRDHYVDVSTDRGRASLLMRLSDALDEVDGVDGAQVHRSHWVSWTSVSAVQRDAGKLTLVMRDGSRIPVSKTYRGLVEDRGLGMARAEVPPHKMAIPCGANSPSNAGSSAQSPPV